jgi:hypothetical protein
MRNGRYLSLTIQEASMLNRNKIACFNPLFTINERGLMLPIVERSRFSSDCFALNKAMIQFLARSNNFALVFYAICPDFMIRARSICRRNNTCFLLPYSTISVHKMTYSNPTSRSKFHLSFKHYQDIPQRNYPRCPSQPQNILTMKHFLNTSTQTPRLPTPLRAKE